MRPSLVLPGFALLLLTAGCRGKLLATAELHANGSTDVHFHSTGASVVLWADIAGSWKTSQTNPLLPVHYDIDFLANGRTVGHAACTTMASDHRVCSTSATVGSQTLASCEDRLSCLVPKLPPGDILMRVTGSHGGLGLVVVKNMSLNVRAE